MGTITINVDSDVEEKFRNAVSSEKGVGKGKFGEAVTEALELWVSRVKDAQIAERQIKLLEKGFYKLGKYKFRREDAYER